LTWLLSPRPPPLFIPHSHKFKDGVVVGAGVGVGVEVAVGVGVDDCISTEPVNVLAATLPAPKFV